ncbi:hypothetical protein, partial [Propionimicrobium lymphophilum]
VSGLWQGIQSLAGWLWDRVSSWVSSIWDGILGFFGIHSPSKQMAWVGDMLVAGLAGAISSEGHKAADAATDMAKETMGAMDELAAGIDVPINISNGDLSLPRVNLEPVDAFQPDTSYIKNGASPLDVEGIVDTAARRILGALDVQVVLNDGTLVGKLAPRIDQQLSRLSRRSNLLAGV